MSGIKNYIKFDRVTGHVVSFFSCADPKQLTDDTLEINDSLGPHLMMYEVDTNSRTAVRSVKATQDIKIGEIKSRCARLLGFTDWQVMRHQDQKYLNNTTSLTSTEYTDLLINRQKLRDASSTMESDIKLLTNADDILNYDVVNNPLWDV